MRALSSAIAALALVLPALAVAQPPPAGDVPPPPPPPPAGDVPPPPAGDVPPPPPGDVPPPPPAYDPAGGGAVPPPPGATPPPAEPEPPPGPDAYNHDGFHLRMALGVGGAVVNRTGTNDRDDIERESKISGGAFAMELTIGGTVGPVVLGGIIALAAGQGDATIEPDDGSDPVALDGGFDTWILAFLADWYPWTDGGFHVGGAIGLLVGIGRLPPESAAVEFGIEQVGGAGFGFSLSTGYDFWIGRQWSMGPLLRVTAGRLHGEGDLTDGTRRVHVVEDDGFFSLSLNFSAALH